MQLKKPHILLVFLCIYRITTSAQVPKTDDTTLESKINEVEHSLKSQVHIQGEALWNLEERMLKYQVQGLSIAVINNYEIEWAKGYGTTNNAEKGRVTPQTVFQAASMSKFVNAMALMKLKELQNVDLDADINTLLSSWKFPYNTSISEQTISLRQLMSHTAGISTHGFGGYKDAKKLPSIIEILAGTNPANSEKVKPLGSPNKNFKYSGGGTTISQLILSDVTNMSYEKFVNENLFTPLQMNNSFYSIELKKYPQDIAFGHLRNGKTLKNRYQIYPESAAAGLWTTPSDLGKLLIDLQLSLANKNGKVLSTASSKELITPPLTTEISALGLFVENRNGHTYLQHSGSNRGFRGKFYVGAANGKGVIVMVNGTNTKIIEEIIRSVALVYEWSGFSNIEIASDQALQNSDLKKYTGTYVFKNREVIVSIKKGKLIAEEKRKWSTSLTPIGGSLFVADAIQPETKIEFVSDKEGTVNKLIAHQGVSIKWKKVDKK